MARSSLPTVTLCAATSVNLAATIAGLRATLTQIEVGRCLLFSDRTREVDDPAIVQVQIPRLSTSKDYSRFMLHDLGRYIETEHCLVVQWDGFVINAGRWEKDFLTYDYIGAPWPQFHDGFDVGNGGFSLRSRRLLDACADLEFVAEHPEDVAICRTNRALLERKYGIRFAPVDTANRFSVERSGGLDQCFGFHGAFHMIDVLGPDRFWEIYKGLDDRQSLFTDFATLYRRLGEGGSSYSRRFRFFLDMLARPRR